MNKHETSETVKDVVEGLKKIKDVADLKSPELASREYLEYLLGEIVVRAELALARLEEK